MVEFSLVIVLFVSVLYALIYFGMALATKQRVTNAAAEGARAAVGAPTPEAARHRAEARVLSLLDPPNGRYTVVPVDAACPPPAAAGALCMTVTVRYDWANYPVVAAAPGLGVFPLDEIISKAVVQYAG